MKISSALLTLWAVQQATAFVVPTTTSHASTSALSSSYQTGSSYGRDYGTRTGYYEPQSFPEDRSYAGALTRYNERPSSAPSPYWDQRPSTVQGTSRRTWNNRNERIQTATLQSPSNRPMEATVEVWDGPNSTPSKLRVFSEDGLAHPLTVTFETPNGGSMNVQNSGPMEMPVTAGVTPGARPPMRPAGPVSYERVDGGALKTFAYGPDVTSAEISISSDGLPISAIIEMRIGQGSARQVAEIESEDGLTRPITLTMENAGQFGNMVILVRNKGPVEFPLSATVSPMMFEMNRYFNSGPYYNNGPEYNSSPFFNSGQAYNNEPSYNSNNYYY